MAKELLWLNADGQVIASKILHFYTLPGTRHLQVINDVYVETMRYPDQLVVRISPEARDYPSSEALWVLAAGGKIMQYFSIQWEHSLARYHQITLLPCDDPCPVPAAIARYVEAYKTSEHEKDTPC